MENIGWPELFGYDMNRYLTDAEFAIEQQLRQLIFWADNVLDDTIPSLRMTADVGMYWDMTLFGMQIRHSTSGMPDFLPHPFQHTFDPSTLGRFDFATSGEMPSLLAKYQRMRQIVADDYAGKIAVEFPRFHRGPLDIYVQIRGYENFLDDSFDRPAELKDALIFLADERFRFAEERRKFLGEATLPDASFVADDWVNIPFITPTFFRETMAPVYAHIQQQEGPVTGFHTCGNFTAVAQDLLQVFPDIHRLEVSGWNDLRQLDPLVDARIHFDVAVINTVTLGDAVDEQREKLAAIRLARRHRAVGVCAQAIVKLYPTYEETIRRLNLFLCRAHQQLAEGSD
jgi:hypothetical protein